MIVLLSLFVGGGYTCQRQAVPETSHRTQAPGGLSKKTTSCLQPCTCEADKKHLQVETGSSELFKTVQL